MQMFDILFLGLTAKPFRYARPSSLVMRKEGRGKVGREVRSWPTFRGTVLALALGPKALEGSLVRNHKNHDQDSRPWELNPDQVS